MPCPSESARAASMDLSRLLHENLEPLVGRTVLVVGDLMIDRYLWGSVDRICYEAPVPVLRHERDTYVLGAAANVAHNVAALGGRARLLGVIGDDEEGLRFRGLLADAGIDDSGLIRQSKRCTSVKTRILSQGQQMLRIDQEDTNPVSPATEEKIIRGMSRLAKGAGAIVLSDYAKGVVSRRVVEAALALASGAGIPVLVDPKGTDYAKYRGVDVMKPNDREVSLAVGRVLRSEADLVDAGRELMRRCGIKALTISRGAEGAAVLMPRKRVFTIRARAKEVYDVSGAGDTFLAALSMGLACGLGLEDATVLANNAGSIAVGKLGVATVSREELRQLLAGGEMENKVQPLDELEILLANLQAKGKKIVFTNGCFDLLHPGHIQFLHEAKRLGDVLVVGLNTDRSVRALKGAPRPILPGAERAAILSALQVVDYIVFYDELTPEGLLQRLRPDLLVKGRNIPENQVVGREIVRSYGGEVRRLPILHDATVSHLVDSIRGKFDKKVSR